MPQRDDEGLNRPELFDLLISELADFFVVLANEQGNFTTWHPGVQTHFGYTAEEFIGQSVEILLPLAERMRGMGKRELEQAAETGRASDTRWLVGKSGQRILVEGVTLALRAEGKLVGFGKVSRDVTERKNTEDSLRALTAALDQAAVIVRRWDGTIDHWTAGCERLYGWTAEEAVGHVCQELLRTVFPAPLDQIQQQLLLSKSWKGEVQHLRRDGTRLVVATHWVLLTDSDQEPMSVIETQTDVSSRSEIQHELELANERLQRMAVELERSNQELEEFARIASHDLSAPITSTRWLVDVLTSRYSASLDPNGQKCLQQVAQSLDRMADLVDGVLAHALVGKSTIGSQEATSAGEALASALENLRRDIEIADATIESGALPAVQIDAQALTQLFQNLLSNAIKYQRAGTPPLIRVKAARQGAEWLFEVQDNGMGIEPEWYERIFQPLQRLHGSEISGSGIGLATCKKIVSRAGGRIWVESELDVGSTFYFTLPGPAAQRE
ncbi:MAG: PAS domain S-box protein [Acidobacteriaceae bacterium]|nr:PAS domain S-box protein [Acidobacteriaceae bacterium]